MGKRNSKNNIKSKIIGIIFVIIMIFCEQISAEIQDYVGKITKQEIVSYELSEIPEYESSPYVTINNNMPNFEEKDYTTKTFEKYSKLDRNGRCGVAFANICKETMPPKGDERGKISSVKPTGWEQKNIMENICIIDVI